MTVVVVVVVAVVAGVHDAGVHAVAVVVAVDVAHTVVVAVVVVVVDTKRTHVLHRHKAWALRGLAVVAHGALAVQGTVATLLGPLLRVTLDEHLADSLSDLLASGLIANLEPLGGLAVKADEQSAPLIVVLVQDSGHGSNGVVATRPAHVVDDGTNDGGLFRLGLGLQVTGQGQVNHAAEPAVAFVVEALTAAAAQNVHR